MSILLKGGTVVSAYNRRQLDIRIDGEPNCRDGGKFTSRKFSD